MLSKLNTFADTVVEGSIDFFKRNYLLLLFAFLAGLFVYGFDIVNMTLSIDEEAHWATAFNSLTVFAPHLISIFIMNKLLSGIFYPFIAPVLALLILSFTSVLMIYKYESSFLSKSIFVILFTSFPSFAHIAEHTYFSAYVAIAVLLSVVAGKCYLKTIAEKKYFYLFISIFLIAVAYTTYRPTIYVFFMPIILDIIFRFTTDKLSFKQSIIFIFISIILMGVSIMFVSGLTFVMAGSISAGNYYESFIGWGSNNIGTTLSRVFTSMYRFLFGVRAHTSPIMFTMFIAFFALLAHFAYKLKSGKLLKTVQLFILVIIFMCAACGVIITLGAPAPLRTLITAAFLFASMIYLYFINSSKIEQLIVILFTAWSILFHASFVTKLSMSDAVMTEADKMTATRVLDNIYDKAPDFLTGKYKVAFLGFYDTEYRSPNLSRLDVFGASFWSWDNGNPGRMLHFLNFYGLPTNIQLANEEEYAKAMLFAANMPVYPDKDSVAVMDDIIVVKFPYIAR